MSFLFNRTTSIIVSDIAFPIKTPLMPKRYRIHQSVCGINLEYVCWIESPSRPTEKTKPRGATRGLN